MADRDTMDADFETVVALTADGKILVAGKQDVNVSSWDRCISVSNGSTRIMALRDDGTVYCTNNYDVRGWKNIVSISADSHYLGLKTDGTVVYAGNYGDSGYSSKLFEVSRWRNITAIAAGSFHTVGLKSDGTLVACGTDINGACKVEELAESN